MKHRTHSLVARVFASVLIGCLFVGFMLGVTGVHADETVPPDAGAARPIFKILQADGTPMTAQLLRIDPQEIVFETAGAATTLSLLHVRVVERIQANAIGESVPTGPVARAVRLKCTDGSTLEADDYTWDGTQHAVLVRPEGRIELPIDRVQSLAWFTRGAVEVPLAADGAGEPVWVGSIPEGTQTDLVVVGTPEAFEFVECAITAVSADLVTVVLDEETIPVKRSKVIGLAWLRDGGGHSGVASDVAARGIRVDVSGGSLKAHQVGWTPEGLVLDNNLRFPAAMLQRIDYAAGRTVSVATLPTERLDVEPYFGALGKMTGMAAFFSPRVLSGGLMSHPGLLIRPRTVAVWRLPANSQRFLATVAPVAGQQISGNVVVVIALDEREVFRRLIAADAPAGIPIDIDVSGSRRLKLTVDFGSAGPGGGIVFADPIIEK